MTSLLLSLKSLSRTVHNDQDHEVLYDQLDQRPDTAETTTTTTTSNSMSLTVWRKSLLINCNGFTVIDSNGDLIYRVDNYVIRPQEIILMNASGESILTMRRRNKKLGLVDNWFVYEGEISDDQEHYNKRTSSLLSSPKKPIYCIKKNINNPLISTKSNNVIAHIYRDKRLAYAIEGSYKHRSCKVLDIGGSKEEVVAETRSKEEIVGGVSYSYGVDVFQLIVHPGFDPSFAMALVLLLDQMF